MAFPKDASGAYVALNRFGFGARPSDLAQFASDPIGALRQDIVENRVAQLAGPDLVPSIAAIAEIDEFKTARKLARDKQAQADEQAKMNAAENQAKSPDFVGPPAKPAPKPETPQQRYYRAETLARVQAAIEAKTGFAERLVWFWSNHFCVSERKGGITAACAGPYEREAIRPHVFGKFEDMLLAVEQHPAMLNYLDNRQSIGPNSRAGVRRDKGLNENLARENLELHTLGVDGGYSQADVTTLAKIITGWTIIGRNDDNGELGQFSFNPNRHEPGEQILLGRRFAEGGIEQGEAALRFIATHPSTARHIAIKLARHFVADDPPPALVARLATVFSQSKGDLAKVSLALLEAPESWQPSLQKMRSPQEFVVATLRATLLPFNIGQINGPLRAMGQPFWAPSGPNGYPDGVADWASPEGLTTRLDFAQAVAKRIPAQVNPLDLAGDLIGDSLSRETREAIQRAESKPQGLALMFMSPEFQRR